MGYLDTNAIIILFFVTLWFFFSLIKKEKSNNSLVLGLGLILFTFLSAVVIGEVDLRSFIVFLMIFILGLKLSFYTNNKSNNKNYREKCLRHYNAHGIWVYFYHYVQFYLLQGALIYLILLPVFLINRDVTTGINYLDFLGFLIWTVGFCVEFIGDSQAKYFLTQEKNKEKLIENGLWRFTKHPNYVGKVLCWWGLWVVSLSVAGGLFTVISPIIVTILAIKAFAVSSFKSSIFWHNDFGDYIEETKSLFSMFSIVNNSFNPETKREDFNKNTKKEGINKRVLVTGGAGFIGSYTAKALIEKGYDVIIVDDFNEYYDSRLKEDRVSCLLKGKKFKLYRINIADLKALREVFIDNNIDIVVHQAAQAGVRYSLINPEVYQKSNVEGTFNVLECCREFGIGKLVFASSSSVYGERTTVPFKESENTNNPVSFYAATKKTTEEMCYTYHSLHNIKMVGLRYFTCYGEWGRPDMALFEFTKNIIEGKPINIYGEGKMKRDFTYIEDIVDGVMKAVESDFDYEIINLGYGSPLVLTHFIEILENILGKEAIKNFIPMQKGDVSTTYADISKAKKLLKWQPKTPAREGVERFVKWYKDYYQRDVKKIGIVGVGMVGGALEKYLKKNKDVELFVYDKGQKRGSVEEFNKGDVIFICVPTPYREKEGGFDLSYVEETCDKLEGRKIVVIKSTVLPGTTDDLQKKYPQHKFLFNPEFLVESIAKETMEKPDRQIMGYTKESKEVAEDVMNILPDAPYKTVMPAKEAEMVKYFGNNFLSVKVIFGNQLFDICEKININYDVVRKAVSHDPRIGPSHLDIFHGGYRGYGGKCLIKDTRALIQLADRNGVSLDLLKKAEEINNELIKEQGIDDPEKYSERNPY